jgi:hypothetical protein
MDGVEKAPAVVEGRGVNAEAPTFGFVRDIPVTEKSELGKVLDVMKEFREVTAQRGPVIPVAMAAQMIGVSSARACQFMDSGRIEYYVMGDQRYPFLNSVEAFLRLPRSTGRPRKAVGVLQGIAMGVKAGWTAANQVCDKAGM